MVFERFRPHQDAEPLAAVPVVSDVEPEAGPVLPPSQEARGVETGPEAPVLAPLPPVQVPASGVIEVTGTQTSRLPRFALIALTMGGIALTFSLFRQAANIVAPVFLALNLMITVYPIHRWLTRQKVPAWISAILSGVTVILVLLAFVVGLFWSVAAMVQQMPQYSAQFTDMYTSVVEFLTARFGLDETFLLETLRGSDPQRLLSIAGGLLSDVQGIASLLLVVLTSVIFMMMDTSSMDARLVAARRSHPQLVEGFTRFATGVRSYWLVTTVFGIIVALLDWGVLIGVGVPLAAVWALFSFLTNYIPNIGFVIGVIPPALLAYFDSGPRSALVIIGSYSVLNFVVQSIIQPKFAGDAVGITASLSFLSLLLWTAVLGPLGALLALPCTLLVKSLLIDTDPHARWVNYLISSRPDTGDPVAEPNSTA